MISSNKVFIFLLALFLIFGFIMSKYWVYDEASAKKCGIDMLNEYGFDISTHFNKTPYSSFLSEPVLIESSQSSFEFLSKMKFENNQIDHFIEVPANSFCPSMFANSKVSIPDYSTDAYINYLRGLRR